MKKLKTITLIVLLNLNSIIIFAQPFTLVLDMNDYNLSYGPTVAWGDFNNDTQLDFILTDEGTTQLFINLGLDNFNNSEIGQELYNGITFGSIGIGDNNNDGFLDLVLTGVNNIGDEYHFYGGAWTLKNNGDETFNPGGISGVFHNAAYNQIYQDGYNSDNGLIKLADFDKDGDLDCVITGFDDNKDPHTKIYWNNRISEAGKTNSPQLLVSDIILPGGRALEVADFNNDNYPDIIVSGRDINGYKHTSLFTNNGNKTFDLQSGLEFENIEFNRISCSDYDNDGFLDILMTSYNDYHLYLYRNLSNNTFSFVDSIISSQNYYSQNNSNFSFVDFDNDGLLDISFENKIFKNNDNSNFTEFLSNVPNGYWGDYDNDGDLDILNQHGVYRNNSIVYNTKPQKPTDLQFAITGTQTKLSWEAGTDQETPTSGLSYNVYIYDLSAETEIVTAMADTITGKRKVTELGNAYLNKEYIINNLHPGTYIWGVQTIDNGFAVSEFAKGSFTILPAFTSIDTFDPDIWNDAIANCADYDNDNDLDIFIDGESSNSTNIRFLMKNLGSNSFNPIYSYPLSNSLSNAEFGDYNNDGKVDLYYNSHIYQFDIDGEIMSPYVTIPNSGINGSWGDYDNDGDLDLLLDTKIYRNDGSNNFSLQNTTNLPAQGIASFADIDNDADLDVLILGSNTQLFLNIGDGTYSSLQNQNFVNVSGTSAWGDYDNDGDLDVVVAGISAEGLVLDIYRNDGKNLFTEIQTNIRKVQYSSVAWGDFNNDGYLDLIIMGRSASDNITKLYVNKKDGTFEEFTSFEGLDQGSAVWGDFDNDLNLDLLLTGVNYNGYPKKYLYKNNSTYPNYPPSAPENLKNELQGFDLKLSWDKASDPNCPEGSLYYNIRMGTTPGGIEIVSPMSDVVSGQRRIPAIGNAQCNTFSILKNLEPGKNYYWSVQAIDQSFAGGAWAPEQSFNLPNISANFSADTVCFGSPMSFADNSLSPEEPITSWLWDFGDGGGTSTAQNPQYTYGNYGSFNVSLTAQSANYTHTITKTVVVKPAPVASFTAPAVCQGNSTVITNNSQISNVNISSWNWTFGDATPDFTGQFPSPHPYQAGSWFIKLKVNADNGCADSLEQEVLVGKIPSNILSTNGTTTFCEGDKFTLTAEAFPNFKYEWRKDNVPLLDKTSNLLEVTESGTYKAIITNLLGNCSVTSTDYAVTVNPVPLKPILTFTENPAVYCQGNVLDISTTNIADINYQWLKNNSPISGATGNSIQANETGIYRLLVSNNYGCSDTSSTKVDLTIHPKPNVSSTLSVSGLTTFCAGNSVQLEAEYNPDYIYKWKKDGIYIVASENIFKPNQTGNYSAEVSTVNNCTINTNPVAITVYPVPEIPDINNAASLTICDGDNIDLTTDAIPGLSYQWYLNGGALADGKNPVYIASQEGIYTLSAINSNNCSVLSTKSVDLKVVKLPSNTNIQLNGLPTICPGQPIELSIENIPGLTYQWKKEGDAIIGAINASFVANSSGNYSVEITNNQCSVTSPLQPITEKAGPPIPEMFLRGEVVWYIACTAAEGANYTWYKNGDSISNSNHNIIVPNPAEGTYYVELSDGSECPSRSVDVKIPDDFKTGKFKTLIDIDGLKDSKTSAVIYPNPNHGKFNLMLDNEYKGKLYIKIKDLSGRTMRQYYADKNESFFLEKFDLSNYTKGVYFIEVNFNNKKGTNKIVLE